MSVSNRLIPIAANQLVLLSFGVLGIKIVTSIVPPDVYGSYALFLTLTQMGVLLSHAGLMNHASRNWQRNADVRSAYLGFLARNSLRKGLFFLPGLVAIAWLLTLRNPGIAWLAAAPLLWLTNTALAVSSLASLILNAWERHWMMLSISCAASIGRALLPAGFALLTGATFLSLAVGFTCHSLVVVVVVVLMFWRLGGGSKTNIDQEQQWSDELVRYGRPFVFLGVGGWLLQNADRWIVDLFFGSERAGVFALASNLSAIAPNLVDAGLMQLVFPHVFRQADSGRTARDWEALVRLCDRATVVFLSGSVLGLAAIVVAGPYLIGVVIAESYRAAIPILWFGGAAMVTVKINQFQYLLLQGQHNSRAMVKVMLVVALVKTLGGAAGAAISWEAFLLWLLVSPVMAGSIGRWMIHREFLRGLAPTVNTDPVLK